MKHLCLSSLLIIASCLVSRADLVLQRLYTSGTSSNPPTCLVQGNDGNFYGTFIHESFALGYGTVFRMAPDGSVTSFGFVPGLNDGLALADDGNFYGTTTNGGLGYGSILRISSAGQITTVYSFPASNSAPIGIRAGLDGCLYGACQGTNNFRFLPRYLNIFRFETNGVLTILHTTTNAGGLQDVIDLPMQGADGFLYGSMSLPQVSPWLITKPKILFYRLSTNGGFQTIYTVTNSPGAAGDLVFGLDGFLYGVIGDRRTYPAVDGLLFKLSTNGVFTTLFSFSGTNGSDPEARLLPASDGYLYGTTFRGGTAGSGTLFRASTNGALATLVNFEGSTGVNPLADLIQGNDDNIYGTTRGSQFSALGTIYRLVQTPAITGLVLTNGSATLTWNSFTDGIYRVEYKPDLSAPAWTTLIQRVTATDATISVYDNLPAPDNRLYRIVLLP